MPVGGGVKEERIMIYKPRWKISQKIYNEIMQRIHNYQRYILLIENGLKRSLSEGLSILSEVDAMGFHTTQQERSDILDGVVELTMEISENMEHQCSLRLSTSRRVLSKTDGFEFLII